MKTLLYKLTFLFFICLILNPVAAQDSPDCDDLITPPVTEDMYTTISCSGREEPTIFTYEEFQASSDDVDDILDIPLDSLELDSTLSNTSVENAIDILSANFGNMSLQELMDCFDVLCSPQLAAAQAELDSLVNALANADSLSQEELDGIIDAVNSEGEAGEEITLGDVETELGLGDINDLAPGLASALDTMDLQALIIEALGIDTACAGESPWGDLFPDDGDPFGDPAGGPGGEFVKKMENQVSKILMEYIASSTDLGKDPNWFLGEIEGLGMTAPGTKMPNPDALSTINAIQSAVNLYNGNASFSMPLDAISSKDVSVPISIHGTPGGLKVDDQEALLGSNMNISAGGKITRVVNGLPDEFRGDLQNYAYGYKRGVKPVTEFLGVDTELNLNLDGIPGWMEKPINRAICRILNILISDLLDQNISTACSGQSIDGIIGRLQDDPAIEGEIDNWLNGLENANEELLKAVLKNYKVAGSDGANFGFLVYWTPRSFNYLQTVVSIKVNLGIFEFVLALNFRAGLKVVDIPSPVLITKNAIGSNYLSDSEEMNYLDLPTLDVNNFENLNAAEKLEFFNQAYSTKKRSDFEFFDPKLYRFMEIMGDLESLFNTSTNEPYPIYHTTQLDLEPDEYYYDFGGYSGKFYFQPDGEIILVPYQDFEIQTIIDKDEIKTFVFITPEGIQYTFDQKAISRYDTYNLPSFFKYPEKGTTREKFNQPVLAKVEYPTFNFLQGLPRFMEVKKDFLTNYHVEKGQAYTSAWYVNSIVSKTSRDSVSFTYEDRELHYNSAKNWTHTFPNFGQSGSPGEEYFTTEANPDLGIHFKSTEWRNGFADLTYSMSEVFVTEPVVKTIDNHRGKKAIFHYNQANPALPGSQLCTRIDIHKNNLFYKGWEFGYTLPAYTEISVSCGDTTSTIEGAQGPAYAENAEYALDLDVAMKDENDKFIFQFPIGINFLERCIRLVIPVKLKMDIEDHAPDGYYFMNRVSEFGSLMQIKTLLDLRDDREEERYQAEFIRNFLRQVYEIDAEEEAHEIAQISYQGNLDELPKRFSIHQDIWGYYNGISTSQSPFIAQFYTNASGSTHLAKNTDHFAFKHAEVSEGDFNAGRIWQANLEKATIGQIDSISFETGAFLQYSYDLHDYPVDPDNFFTRGGLRISALARGSVNGSTQRTQYLYHQPTVVNYPLFMDQHPLDRYYKDLELRVKTSWKPLNQWQMNGSGYVGYARVDEVFEDNGRIEHYFTNPTLPDFEPLRPAMENLHIHYKRTLRWENNYYQYSESNLDYHPAFGPLQARSWRLGLENATKVYDENNVLLQESEARYAFSPMLGNAGSLQYPSSRMFQFLHYGSYDDFLDEGNLYHQVVDAGVRCYDTKLFQIIRFLIRTIHTQHPYRYIEKDFPQATIVLESEKVELQNTITTNYFQDGENTITSDYVYYGNIERKLQSLTQTFTTAQSENVQSSSTEYYYADNLTSSANFGFVDEVVMYDMDQFNYELPVIQINKLNGTPVSGSAVVFQQIGSRFLPLSVWSIREGAFALTGKFESYSSNGMPTSYRLAKFATGDDINTYGFFPPITMTWNDNLLPLSRSFEGFTTTNTYNDLCQLETSTDANNLSTQYTYDLRRRLESVLSPGALQTATYTYQMNPLKITTTTTFSDGTITQKQEENKDGWGNFLSLVRSDGAILAAREYDHLFRLIAESQLGRGMTHYRYEASPLGRVTETEDAVGNVSKMEYLAPHPDYPELFPFNGVQTTDPNGHIAKSWQDAFGKPVLSISGAGGITRNTYDPQGRIDQIINPIGEVYHYTYNTMGLLASKDIPNKGTESYWYDRSMRMVAKNDANATVLLDYDNLYRLSRIAKTSIPDYGPVSSTVLEEEVVNGDMEDDLLVNSYVADKTWLGTTVESILKGGGVDGTKSSIFSHDNLGRVTATQISYSNGHTITENITSLNDANIPLSVDKLITGPDGITQSMTYDYAIDGVLRPTTTHLQYAGQNTLIEKLEYNDFDQIIQKHIGATTDGFLQTVDYTYDGAGKILTINQPIETGCLFREEVCQLYWGNVESNISLENQNCGLFTGIVLDGTTYTAPSAIALSNTTAIEDFIDEQIGQHGKVGAAEVFYQDYFGVDQDFHLSIMQTDIASATVLFENCQYPLASKDCCEIEVVGQDGIFPLSTSPGQPDLFFEKITYDGLDITMIEMIGSCSAGLIRNHYRYDGDHRLTQVRNTLFAPHKIDDAFTSSYTYDAAGNILSLQRNGWVAAHQDFTLIDDLSYTYEANTSKPLTSQ